MNSDTSRRQPDAPFVPAGPGMSATFACTQCNVHKSIHGRKFQLVRKGAMRGIRGWVCAECKGPA